MVPQFVFRCNPPHRGVHRRPVASLAVLGDADANWRPDRFEYNLYGFSHDFRFPIVKLLDYRADLSALEQEANPLTKPGGWHL
jgi:hypothetical protein